MRLPYCISFICIVYNNHMLLYVQIIGYTRKAKTIKVYWTTIASNAVPRTINKSVIFLFPLITQALYLSIQWITKNTRAPHKGLQQPLKAAPLHAESRNRTWCDTIRMTSGNVLKRGFPYGDKKKLKENKHDWHGHQRAEGPAETTIGTKVKKQFRYINVFHGISGDDGFNYLRLRAAHASWKQLLAHLWAVLLQSSVQVSQTSGRIRVQPFLSNKQESTSQSCTLVLFPS